MMEMSENTKFQNTVGSGILELIVFSLSPYKTYAVLCFRNPAVIFGRGYMPDKLVKHAATVYNRGN